MVKQILGTKIRALKEAQKLLQTVGFNGFSFQHVADRVGVKKPSLYDHFASKEELGRDLILDYRQSFETWTQTIDVFEPKDQVGALFETFFRFSEANLKYCPLNALIADYHTLPKKLQKPLRETFDFQRDWLTAVIEAGQKKKVFRKDEAAAELSAMIFSLGLGSQFVARITEDPDRIRKIKLQALKLLEV